MTVGRGHPLKPQYSRWIVKDLTNLIARLLACVFLVLGLRQTQTFALRTRGAPNKIAEGVA